MGRGLPSGVTDKMVNEAISVTIIDYHTRIVERFRLRYPPEIVPVKIGNNLLSIALTLSYADAELLLGKPDPRN